GRRGQPFRFFKLRTMVSDAETLKPALDRFNEMSGPVFKMRNDPRVTRVGRWLRRTSIDEIPQFVNVLRGEMSIVGPRPPLPAEVDHYTDSDLRRLCMRPGITGLWQVRGRNQIKSFADWVQLDAEYIRNWSLWLDFGIVLRTVAEVLRLSGR